MLCVVELCKQVSPRLAVILSDGINNAIKLGGLHMDSPDMQASQLPYVDYGAIPLLVMRVQGHLLVLLESFTMDSKGLTDMQASLSVA